MDYSPYNAEFIRRLSIYLNQIPDFVTGEIVGELVRDCRLSEKDAFLAAFAAGLGLSDGDPFEKVLIREYLPAAVTPLAASDFRRDPYYAGVSFPAIREKGWEYKTESYAPYEVFVSDDFKALPDGRVLPQIGFFSERFDYPAVLEGGREWMTVTPNEINTMAPVIAEAEGDVLTFGLGLGYFAYMTARKDTVGSVTVVERDPAVIELFQKYLLPQFPCRDKIRVVREDAFAFASRELAPGRWSLVFTDLWHDPSDGVALWERMRRFEGRAPGTRFRYWIEPTLRHYAAK